MDKLVSIVMPIYNVEKYLERAIYCVRNQTYRNLQIILVDDGSKDSSGKICDKYAAVDKRIKVIHKKNGGLSDARNAGLRKATGKYVYFFDPDDFIELNLVEICVLTIEKEKSNFVVFNYRRIKNEKEVMQTKFREGTYNFRDSSERWNFVYSKGLQYEIGWEAWSRFFSLEYIREKKLEFWDNRVIFAEDLAFMIASVFTADKISVIEKCLYNYELREDSIMGGLSKIPINKFIGLSSKVIEHRLEWNIDTVKAEVIAIKILMYEMDKCESIKQLLEIIDDIENENQIKMQKWGGAVIASEILTMWERKKVKCIINILQNGKKQELYFYFMYKYMEKVAKKFKHMQRK